MQPSHLQSPQPQALLSAHGQVSHAQSSQAHAVADELQSHASQAQSTHLQTPQQHALSASLTAVVDELQHHPSRTFGTSPALMARPTDTIRLKIRFMKSSFRTPPYGRSNYVKLLAFARRAIADQARMESAPRADARRRGCTGDHAGGMRIN